ncbi:tail fiber domain-containing protein, partial [Kluyvera sichuanensis]
MSAGTLKLTNGSTAVTGTGTSFTTDLTTADFVVVTVGGTTHSLAVDSVTNATALVLSAPFTGPTTASVAWQAVPRKAMLRVTAELNRQVNEALRLGNENAINWQAVLSADDTATVVLPDGTTLTGLSWKKLSEIMTDMDIDAIKPLAAQIHTDAAQVAADKPVIV